eukprot:8619187-Alexandrium_andersonii.AAC.1
MPGLSLRMPITAANLESSGPPLVLFMASWPMRAMAFQKASFGCSASTSATARLSLCQFHARASRLGCFPAGRPSAKHRTSFGFLGHTQPNQPKLHEHMHGCHPKL